MNDLAGDSLAFGYGGDVTDGKFDGGYTRKWPRKRAQVNICVPAAGVTRDGLAVKVDKQNQPGGDLPGGNLRGK